MRAAHTFVLRLRELGLLDQVARIQATLFGSLAHTGRGHGTDKAVMLGLEGNLPDQVDPDVIPQMLETITAGGQLTLPGDTRVDFNRQLGAVGARKGGEEAADQALELLASEISRRPTSDVEDLHWTLPLEEVRENTDLPREVLQIVFRHRSLERGNDVAPAVKATVLTEGNVDINSERHAPAGSSRFQAAVVVLAREILGELHRRRVARVARTRTLIALDQRLESFFRTWD